MKKLTLILSDIAVLYGSLMLVIWLRYSPSEWLGQYQMHFVPFSLLFVFWLFSFYIANLYDQRALRNNREFYERLLQATITAAALSTAFFYLIPYFVITPKTNLFLFIIIFALFEAGVRYIFNGIIAGGSKKRLLIVGVNDESLELASYVTDNPQLGYMVWALAKLGQESLLQSESRWRILENLNEIDEFITRESIDTVVISPQAYRMEDVIGIFYKTLARQVDFISLAAFVERLTGTVPLGAISQTWFLDNISEGTKRSFDSIKRGIDILAVIVLGIPVLALTPFIAALIKLDSRGPVFIRQKRTGRGGEAFDIIKFRSMISAGPTGLAETNGAVWAVNNDPRITRVGRILRESRIDELPQLWNILKGEMSLVGPRAERPEIDAKLANQIPFYPERYLIKPGLSGWAQINYPYGASLQDAIEKLQYDLYYIKHRSLTLDLEIIFKTISISLRRAGR